MSEGAWLLLFLAAWFVFCFGCMGAAWNFDRIVVMVLDVTDIPVFAEARMIAALIYRQSEQWEITSGGMKHPEIGKLGFYTRASSVEMDGAFGKWEPNIFEKRIIWNAIVWRQRTQIRTMARKQIG